MACDKRISELLSRKDNLSKEMTDNDLEIKKIEHKLQRYHKDQKEAAKFVEHLEQRYPWVATEKQ